MVFFTCNACGASLKKNQVEKHYQNECPSCEVLSCIDCGQDFYGDAYAAHTKCISEAEKYQGALYKESGKGGPGKGERKQQEWLEQVKQSVSGAKVNPKVARLLERIADYPNIPRKRSKFENFVRNSFNVRDQRTLEQVWEAFSGATKKCQGDQKASQKVESEVQNSNNQETEVSAKVSTDKPKDVPKKKKRKDKEPLEISCSTEETDVVEDGAEMNGEESGPVPKKKKKKKEVKVETEAAGSDQSEENEMPKKKKKNQKLTDTSTDCVDPSSTVAVVSDEVSVSKKVKKKRRREKENSVDDEGENGRTSECVDDADEVAVPSKKKRKVKFAEGIECDGLMDRSSQTVPKKHKKKHKERILTSEA